MVCIKEYFKNTLMGAACPFIGKAGVEVRTLYSRPYFHGSFFALE